MGEIKFMGTFGETYEGLFTKELQKEKPDLKGLLNGIIDDLFTKVKRRPIEETIEAVRDVTDAYVEEVGERPGITELDRMATLILNEQITDPHPDKMTREEYPIESGTQRARREYGRHQAKEINGRREVSLSWADEVGADGRDYRPQTRDNNRKMRDVLGGQPFTDKSVLKANRERKKRRRDAVKASPVRTIRPPSFPPRKVD